MLDAVSPGRGASFPMLKLRKVCVELHPADVLRRMLRIWHMRGKKVQQRVFRLICEIAVRITPFAIVLIVAAVRFAADAAVLV